MNLGIEGKAQTPQNPALAGGATTGPLELVTLLLKRGADSVEADAESWAAPLAWAEKMKHDAVLSVLRKHAQRQS